jgi:hypothetical protein
VRWFLALALAGCSSHAATGPAWPKQHEADKDGGESLSPHTVHGASVAAAEKSGDDDQPAKPIVATPAAAPAAAKDTPASPTPAATPTEEPPITTEDIIIEIDD